MLLRFHVRSFLVEVVGRTLMVAGFSLRKQSFNIGLHLIGPLAKLRRKLTIEG